MDKINTQELCNCLDELSQNPSNLDSYERAASLCYPFHLPKTCDFYFQAIISAQIQKDVSAHAKFKEKRQKVKDEMRAQYKADNTILLWEDVEDFIADNHETLDAGSLCEYVSQLEAHFNIYKASAEYTSNPYSVIFNSVVKLVPPRYIQPKTFALTSDLKLLPNIIFEDREKKGKWIEGLTKEDIMDDFNENYICFNGLIVPRDYLLFFKYIRTPLTHYYSWAIPNDAALSCIQSFGPIVEIGSGSGYWASLLRKRGTDLIALDMFPPSSGSNPAHKIHHTEIQYGEPKDLVKYFDRTLLLCWPDDYHSNNTQMFTFAADCLKHYTGKYVIYVGDWRGTAMGASEFGYTSSKEFQHALQSDFTKVQRVLIPNWPLVKDDLTVWKRNEI